MHDEAAQRVPSELHPLAGLVAHDADRPALRGGGTHLRVRARLLLDTSQYCGSHEQGMCTRNLL